MTHARNLVFATAAGVVILLQFVVLSAALDLVTSLALVAVGYAAGRFGR